MTLIDRNTKPAAGGGYSTLNTGISAAISSLYAPYYVNQLFGDPDSRNGNCGYASAMMALAALNRPFPRPLNIRGGLRYRQTMALRKLGGGGTADDWSYGTHMLAALNKSRVEAGVLPNSWGTNTFAAVTRLKRLLNKKSVFILNGNSNAQHWPGSQGGSDVWRHYVTVVSYNRETDKFLVLDPATQPIWASSAQLANFLFPEPSAVLQVTRR